MPLVVVTGGTGFVGRAVARRLLDQGWRVRLLARQPPSTAIDGCEMVSADVTDPERMRAACAGAAAVVHLAARVHVMHETATDADAAFDAVNVVGTRVTAIAARDAGVARLVYVSSIKAMGEQSPIPYAAGGACAPQDAYGRSKRRAELALEEVADGAMAWVVLRPPLVVGPEAAGNLPRLLRLAELSMRVPLPFGGIGNRRSVIGVVNLADAIALALRGDVDGAALPIADPEPPLAIGDMLRALAEGLGGRARLWPLPRRALAGMARVLGRGAEADRLFGDLVVDAAAFVARTGWRAPMTSREALRSTGAWWHQVHR